MNVILLDVILLGVILLHVVLLRILPSVTLPNDFLLNVHLLIGIPFDSHSVVCYSFECHTTILILTKHVTLNRSDIIYNGITYIWFYL
jgi:hypothetical protein